jgi:3-hydroxyacyl-CoA dehydrogenase/enoyl-CoA hydratase/3-hydroxybutyryl-CoA epimerase
VPPFAANHLRIEAADGRATVWLDVVGHSHNVFGRSVIAELDAALDHLESLTGLRLVIIRSAKPAGFAAGADLNEFPSLRTADDAVAFSEEGHRVFDRLARLPVPTVAVIHGVCLGGGLELALACESRVAMKRPRGQIGLPEIQLGLVPGWGGLQRLPRVVGWAQALKMILGSKRLTVAEALRYGLVEAATADEAELSAALDRIAGRPRGPRPTPPRRLESTALGRWFVFRHAERALRRRAPDDMPAPFEALRILRETARRGAAAGVIAERGAITRLAGSPATRNLLDLFLRHEAIRKSLGGPQPDSRPVRRVGVVGTGTMGAGIIQLALMKGFEVAVQQRSESSIEAGRRRVERLLRKAAELGLITPDEARRKLDGVIWTTRWTGFAGADLVVESVTEELETKRAVFRSIEQHVRPDTPIATNTSSLCVGWLQEGMAHPGRVVGLHFFHPVHRIPLVEVVRTSATLDAAAGAVRRWAVELGKTPVSVTDSQGFAVNRILMPYVNEALVLLAEGMSPDRIDRVMRRFGMPLGPLEMLDRSGLDVIARMARVMRSQLGNRFAPNPVFDRMCERGWLGRKTGVGFYRYRGDSARPNRRLREVLPEAPRPAVAAGERDRDARDRMVLLMVNEAASCLGRGVAADAETIDLAMVLGTGWAPHRGGPLRYADDEGLAAVVPALAKLARRLGPRFEPCPELRRRAVSGEAFRAVA